MNREAERHLTKAEGYLAKGEDWYRKAAEEIIAAQTADPTVSNREIGERFGRSATWVRELVRWSTTSPSSAQPTPYSGQADAINLRKTKQMLREAPLEQVEQIVGSLPKERQQAIAAAAGHGYLQAQQERAERRNDDAPRDTRRQATAQAVTTFAALGITGHLEQATEELRELTADASLTPTAMRGIERAHTAWVEALDFARAMTGEERR